jgi:hypothetical protein
MLSGTSGECLLAWCIVFISAEEWNARYVAALLPVTSSMASFWQTSEVSNTRWQLQPKKFLL